MNRPLVKTAGAVFFVGSLMSAASAVAGGKNERLFFPRGTAELVAYQEAVKAFKDRHDCVRPDGFDPREYVFDHGNKRGLPHGDSGGKHYKRPVIVEMLDYPQETDRNRSRHVMACKSADGAVHVGVLVTEVFTKSVRAEAGLKGTLGLKVDVPAARAWFVEQRSYTPQSRSPRGGEPALDISETDRYVNYDLHN